MDENGQGPDNDEQKASLEWGETSGVFSVRRVLDVVDQRRDEIARDAYSAVMYQELCGRRARVRNDLRTWAEQVPVLAKAFGKDFIPPMTPQEIANEEQQRIDRKAARIARRHKNDVFMRAVHNYVQTAASPLRDSTQIELEEKAKYLAVKLRGFFSKKDFQGAVHFFHEHVGDFPFPHESEIFADLVYEECRRLLHSLHEKLLYDLLPEALDAVAQMTKLEREDFAFMREGVQIQAEQKVFEDALTRAMSEHPAIYIRMRQTFMDLDFIDGSKMDKNPEIQAAMMQMLAEKIQTNPEIYYSFVSQLHKAGVIDGDALHNSPEMREAIQRALVSAMRNGPIVYILLRDRMAKLDLIDEVGFNLDEDVQDASVEHFKSWYSTEAQSYESFVVFMRRHGLAVPKNLAQHIGGEISLFTKFWYKIKECLVSVDTNYFEEFLSQCRDFDEYFFEQDRKRIAELLRDFSEKYRMFRGGK